MNPYTKIRDFHGTRAKGVGSSDIPTLALLNLRYDQTPYQLWRVKTGRDSPWVGNEATWWGRQHENTVLYRWVRDHYEGDEADRFLASKFRGRSIGELKVLTECRHPQWHFALAHADLLIDADAKTDIGPSIVEAKSHSFFAARRGEDPDFGYNSEDLSQNGLPASVFLQVQWQELVYDIPRAEVAVLINTNDYRCYQPVIADPRTQEKCLALAERFMWHVDHDQEPKPETWADIQAMFPHPEQTTAMVSGDTELEARRMKERKGKLDKSKKRIETELDDLKNAIGLLIGENSVLASAEGDVLAKSWEVKRWFMGDLKKLEQTEPDLFKRLHDDGYITRSENRVLRF